MDFIEALEANNQPRLLEIPKSDLHSHAGRGGNKAFLAERTGGSLPDPPRKFASLTQAQEWFDANIKPACKGTAGQLLRWEACFAEAGRNRILRLALSFTRLDVLLAGGMDSFRKNLEGYHQRYCPQTLFEPELTYGRGCRIDEELEFVDELLTPGFFHSMDLCDGEFQQPIERFLPLYRKAETYGLIKRAHVGEFGPAEEVVRAVEILELQEIQHGISAAASQEVMRFLTRHGIQLNVCPTSNVMLNVASDYAAHPIQTLVRNGVRVTINTDDLLLFNQPIDQEYLNLYRAGTLTARELDDIRRRGLQGCADFKAEPSGEPETGHARTIVEQRIEIVK